MLATALSGVMTAIAALVPAPATASAADCPLGYFCAWAHLNFEGQRIQWRGHSTNWVALDNASSSWFNRSPYIAGGLDDVWVYDTSVYRNFLFCLGQGQYMSYSAAYNDRPSSHKWMSSC
jgi:hypothetical protein